MFLREEVGDKNFCKYIQKDYGIDYINIYLKFFVKNLINFFVMFSCDLYNLKTSLYFYIDFQN